MKKEELKQCNVCNAYDHQEASNHFTEDELADLEYKDLIACELVKCVVCDKYVCDPEHSESCGEILNYDQPYCKTCLDKQTKFDCSICKNKDCNEEWTYCYDCPEYIEVDEEGEDDE